MTSSRADFFAALEARVLLSDDHADLPNYGDATEIDFLSREAGANISYYTAIGAYAGEIGEVGDTDLFAFTAPGDAPISVMAVYQTDLNVLAPAIELRGTDGNVLVSHDGQNGIAFVGPAFTLTGGEQYYVVIRGDAPVGAHETSATGRYAIFVGMDVPSGIDGGGGGGDDGAGDDGSGDDDGGSDYGRDEYPDRDEGPHPVFTDGFTGDSNIEGALQDTRDSDAFRFRVPGAGPLRIQVVSPDEDLTATITVLDAGGATRAISTSALPGAKATVEIVAAPGEDLTVLVDSPDGTPGEYKLEIDASPTLYHYFYPAGYSAATIDEFVPMVNPNDVDVTYIVYAHYETGEPLDILASGTLAPHSRGGITVTTRRDPAASLTRIGVPYAFEIVSTAPISASLGHYDFGITTGEAFTDRLSTRWEFPEVQRAPDIRDFLVYYNPHPQTAILNITLLDAQGTMRRFTRTLEGERRGGINFHNDAAVPADGLYAVWIESDVPIVAAQTLYDVARARGDGLLGQPSAGARAGAFASISTEPGTETRIAILNSSGDQATLRIMCPDLDGPVIYRMDARSRLSLSPTDLGLPPGLITSLTYASDTPVTVTAIQYEHGDGGAFAAATEVSRTFLIGAAWVNPLAKKPYLERLGLLNPAPEAADIRITFLFTDGSSESSTLNLGAGGATTIAIDQHPAILRRAAPTAFSIRIDGSIPIVASFTHYDLFLDGGWGSLASPLGLTVPVESLIRYAGR